MTELPPAARSRVTVDIGELRSQLDAYCVANKTTPSAVVRETLTKMLGTSDANARFDTGIAPDEGDKTRLYIRLSDSEKQAITIISESWGFKTVKQFIVCLLRAFITKRPNFSDSELKILAESNFQLASIGRNINQIAKRLNSEPDVSAYRIEDIKDLAEHIKAHTKLVSDLLRMNVERWRIEVSDGR
jgi:hypothetical protein